MAVTFGASGKEEWVVANSSSNWLRSEDGRYRFTISANPPVNPQAGIPLYGQLTLRFNLLMDTAQEELVVVGIPGRYIATIDEGNLLIRIDEISGTGRSDDNVLIEGFFSASARLIEPARLAKADDTLPVEGLFAVSLGYHEIAD